MNKIIFITGGSRSGKSSYALEIATKYDKHGFIATAIAFDDEMKERIENHKKERDKNFITVEEPYNIAKAIAELEYKVDVIVIDCITVWINNLLYKHGNEKSEFDETKKFLKQIKNTNCDIIIVSNEVGMGIIPENKLARHFRDVAGFLNQQIANLSKEVVLMVSGISLKIKG